jgi:putative DNA primase/helicase
VTYENPTCANGGEHSNAAPAEDDGDAAFVASLKAKIAKFKAERRGNGVTPPDAPRSEPAGSNVLPFPVPAVAHTTTGAEYEANYSVAMDLVCQSFYVHPVHSWGWGLKLPFKDFKWKDLSSNCPVQIGEWWEDEKYRGAAPAIDCGKSELVVIDPDYKNGGKIGLQQWEALIENYGGLPPRTPIVRTPTGGLHVYFRQRKDREPLGCSRGDLPDGGIEVKGVGGYVLGCGAAIETGKYRLISGSFDDIPEIPEWLYDLIQGHNSRQSKQIVWQRLEGLALKREIQKVAKWLRHIPSDDRNEAWRPVGMALRSGFGEEGRILWDLWSERATGKFDEAGQGKWDSFADLGDDRGGRGLVSVRSIKHLAEENGFPDGPIPAQNGPVQPWKVSLFEDIINEELPPPEPEEFGLDKVRVPETPPALALPAPAENGEVEAGFLAEDLDNARRFARQHGEDIRYIPERKSWIIWSGARWVADAEELERRAKKTIDGVLREATLMSGPALPLALKAATNARRESRIRGAINVAKSEKGIAVHETEIDADPWMLGVRNGVVNLKTGEFREMRREDYITKFAGTDFVPGAQCPNWLAFLDMIMGGDVERIAYLQRFTGYMLTGTAQEEAVLLLFGVGRNGKTTFREVVAEVSGSYALTCSSGLLIERKQSEAASPEVASLKGVRLAAVNETEEDGILKEERLKFLASNETITARYLYGNTFTFRPTHKLVITTNHKPVVRGGDLGIWRRLHPLRFGVTIPEDKVEADFRERRLKPEMAGILNWALEGLVAYLKDGLKAPRAVEAERNAYRKEMDLIGRWIEDQCEDAAGAETGATDLYKAYAKWSEEETGIIMKQARFGRELDERGFISRKSHGRIVRMGLRLKNAVAAVVVPLPRARQIG